MWQQQNNSLYRKFEFADFPEALSFIIRVGLLAEKAGHHPRIHNSWNVVELWLTTHDKGDVVTDKDHELSAKIDTVVKGTEGRS